MADKLITDAGVIEQIRTALPIVNTNMKGLYPSNYGYRSISTGNKKYAHIHKTSTYSWASFNIICALMSGGAGDFCVMLAGSTNEGSDGSVSLIMLGAQSFVSGMYSFLWKQNADKSIDVYIKSAGASLGLRTLLIQFINGEPSNVLSAVATLDESGFNEIKIA